MGFFSFLERTNEPLQGVSTVNLRGFGQKIIHGNQRSCASLADTEKVGPRAGADITEVTRVGEEGAGLTYKALLPRRLTMD